MGKVDLCIGVLHDISICHRYSFQYLNALNVPTLLSNSCLSCLAGFYHPSASGTTTWWSRESQDQDPQLLQITTVNTPHTAVSSSGTLNATPSNLPLPSRLASTDLWGLEHRLKQSPSTKSPNVPSDHDDILVGTRRGSVGVDRLVKGLI
jgi:hypothetical protein